MPADRRGRSRAHLRMRMCVVAWCCDYAYPGRRNCLRHKGWKLGQQPGKPCQQPGCKGRVLGTGPTRVNCPEHRYMRRRS